MKNKIIIDYFNDILPSAKCELNYRKDYELIIAVMLSAQTTDARVNEVTSLLFEKYKSIEALKNANLADLKNIILKLGLASKKSENIKKIAQILSEHPEERYNRTFLEALSGVGRKTANVVLSELYDEQLFAVDTHVKRFSKRIGFSIDSDDPLKIEKKLTKIFANFDINKLNHQIIIFGRTICNAKSPKCKNCGLRNICEYKNNL